MAATPRKDIVFVSLEDWDTIWRRNQFICDELARRDPQRRILFVGLPRDLSHAIRKGDWKQFKKNGDAVKSSRENILLTSPTKFLPNSITAGRRFNEMLFRRHVKQAIDRLGFNNPLLWLNAHSAVHLVGRLDECGVIYDITDDWTTLTQSARLAELTRVQDRELCRRADAVIVCSERLRLMKSELTQNLHLIPNGVNAEHYSRVACASRPCKNMGGTPMLRELKHPVVGYVGTIHPDRIDVALIESIAHEMPEATFVLVGPNHLRADEMASLNMRKNVIFTGPVSYEDVPGYLHSFDVCMTPHRVTPFTESLNPIKLWEYLAVGKPIVSTNVAGFRDYPNWVYLASTAPEFVAAIRRGMTEDPAIPLARQVEARLQSWTARVDRIEQVLADCEKGGEPHG